VIGSNLVQSVVRRFNNLLDTAAASTGAGMVGFLYATAYAGNTVGAWLKGLATSAGAAFIGVVQSGAGAVLRTLQDKARETITPQDFGAKGDGVTDDTAAFNAAIAEAVARGGATVHVPQTAAFYLVSGSINVGVTMTAATPTATGAYVELVGRGFPTIKSNNNAVPIINAGGSFIRLARLNLQYTAKPANTVTTAVAIRTYNLAYSVIEQVYAFNVFGLMDMYQGSVAGTGYNACFSNTYRDLTCQQYSGWGIKMLPYVGGNSGSVWGNIYLNANNNTGASGSGATLGGMWLQTSQNETIDLLNVEWQRNAGSALVLNQCHNPTIRSLHFEGLYPTTAFSPLIDVIAGDGSCPNFDAITVTGCDWTGYGAINNGALFRLDNAGARVSVDALTSYNNTNPTFMQALTCAGATCYGSTIEVSTVNDLDGSLSSDGYTPRANVGTATALVEYPVQRWNMNQCGHCAIVTDNAGGTNSTVAAMPGSVVTVPSNDPMGLWDNAGVQFKVKKTRPYTVGVNIPTASSAQIQVKVNGTQVAALTPPAAGGHDSVTVALNRNDTVKLTLASGSYTRTNVSFWITE